MAIAMHDIVYCIFISLATCIIMAALTPIAVFFFVVFITSAHGDGTCKITPCNCSFSNIEVLRNYIEETVNAAVTAVRTEVNNKISATVDEGIAAVSALNTTVDEKIHRRIRAVSATVGALNVSVAKLLNQPG